MIIQRREVSTSQVFAADPDMVREVNCFRREGKTMREAVLAAREKLYGNDCGAGVSPAREESEAVADDDDEEFLALQRRWVISALRARNVLIDFSTYETFELIDWLYQYADILTMPDWYARRFAQE